MSSSSSEIDHSVDKFAVFIEDISKDIGQGEYNADNANVDVLIGEVKMGNVVQVKLVCIEVFFPIHAICL